MSVSASVHQIHSASARGVMASIFLMKAILLKLPCSADGKALHMRCDNAQAVLHSSCSWRENRHGVLGPVKHAGFLLDDGMGWNKGGTIQWLTIAEGSTFSADKCSSQPWRRA